MSISPTPARISSLAAGLGLLVALTGCGSNQALLAERQRGEASELQDICRRSKLVNEDTHRADTLVASAAKHQKDGDEKAALREADRAAILYRLALARRELIETQGQVDALRSSLAKDKDQLQTYQQVLEEVKAVSKP